MNGLRRCTAGNVPDDPQAAAARAAALRAEIERHAYLYYVLDAPEIIRRRLRRAHARARGDRGRVPRARDAGVAHAAGGGAAVGGFAPVRHAQRMYSLDNAMDLDELDAWLERVDREQSAAACGVRRRAQDRRQLARAHLRGRRASRAAPRAATARTGEDVTANVRTVARRAARGCASRSGHVPEPPAPSRCAARSTCRRRRFERLNDEQDEAGAAAVRQPAQRGGRRHAPEGPGGHRVARPVRRSSTRSPSPRAAGPRVAVRTRSRGCGARASA